MEKYDFDYWPPLHTFKPVADASITMDIIKRNHILPGVLHINDLEQRDAVRSRGEWVGIEDFWVEANGPGIEITPAEYDKSAQSTVLASMTLSRHHLAHASRVFNTFSQDVIEYSYYELLPTALETSSNDPDLVRKRQTEIAASLSNGYMPTRLLVLSSFVEGYVDAASGNPNNLPRGLGTEALILLQKVAMRWTHNFNSYEAGLVKLG